MTQGKGDERGLPVVSSDPPDQSENQPGSGNRPGRDLFELAYDELRAMAAGLMQNESSDHTLQPTALVHEVYLRLRSVDAIGTEGKSYFFVAAASAMRRVLVDHARRRSAQKRGGNPQRITLREDLGLVGKNEVDVLSFDRVIVRLEEIDPRMAKIVELRAFAGLTTTEVAETLELSERTVHAQWAAAKQWIRAEMSADT